MHLTTNLTPQQRLDAYTPDCLSSDAWAFAREPVVAAVLAAGPTNAEDAKGLVSRLCQLLAGHSNWDPRTTPELAALVTDAAITVHLTRLGAAGKSDKTRENHRADLRRIARALAGTQPTATRATRTTSAPIAAPAACPATAALVSWLLAGHAPLIALSAWEQTTGRTTSRATLQPVVRVVLAAQPAVSASELTASTVRALSAAKALTTREVSAPTPPTPEPAARAATPGRRPSRAAALRAARTARTALAAPALTPAPDLTALPAAVQDAIRTYRPAALTADQWELLGPLCQRLVTGFNPPSANAARSASTTVAAFLIWAAARPCRPTPSEPLSLLELRTAGLTEAYLSQLTAAGASLATYRSVLRRALRALNPAPAPTIAYQPVAAPYSAAQCAAFVRLARNQPTAARRRELAVIVGLGLGAGLDSRDLRALRAADLTETTLTDTGEESGGHAVLLVQIRGERARTIPVRTLYAALVRQALTLHSEAGRTPDDLLLGTTVGRRNITSPALAHAVTATQSGVDIAVHRLRATWLVDCLSAGVPLGALLHAAGLRSARTLTDLLSYCPAPDPEQVRALLATLPSTAAGVPAVVAGGTR